MSVLTRPSPTKPQYRNNAALSKAQARKLLSPEDKKALPFLGKKCTDQKSPDFGMWQEDRIVKHILERLRLSDFERRRRVQRMQQIDVQLSGMVDFDEEDKKRDRSNKKGKAAKPVKHNLPLAYSQIDDCVTYCMSLFAPETNIFVATSKAEKQYVAEGLTEEIGKQGQTLQYYRHLCKFVLNSIKYNFAGMSCNWETQSGIVFVPDSNNQQGGAITGAIVPQKGTVWEGNVLKSVDCYNFLYDTAVHPIDLPLRGEYFAEVELYTPFRIKRMAQQKQLYGVNRYVNTVAPLSGQDGITFYISPPAVREEYNQDTTQVGRINWTRFVNPTGPARDSQLGLELVWYTGWVIPSEYALSTSDEYECWRICMANGRYITAGYHLDNTHGQLPVAMSTPIEDDLLNDQRTYAEMLLPMQHFASFLLNTHVDATRKAIYGITVYDKALFPGLDLDTEDLIGAHIPMKSSAAITNIDQAFRHYNSAPQTEQNVDMVGKIIELMQKILPTNQAQQVADLERATEYQAAATVQASSRRNLKIARLINDQGISVIKFQMMYNIYQNTTVIKYTDANGQDQNITPQDLLTAAIEFDVGTGLKGLDRLMQTAIFKDLMGYLFQIKDIGDQVDLLGLLSYVTQIAGFETDLSSFKKTPPAVVPPNGQQTQGDNGQAPAPNGLPNQQGPKGALSQQQ